jgi:hypothetical protein
VSNDLVERQLDQALEATFPASDASRSSFCATTPMAK